MDWMGPYGLYGLYALNLSIQSIQSISFHPALTSTCTGGLKKASTWCSCFSFTRK